MTKLGMADISNLVLLLLGTVILKASTTVIVLVRIVDTATVNITPNTICYKIQVAVLGCPMKRKDQRKQNMNDISRMWLRD